MSILDVWSCVYDTNSTNLTNSCFDAANSLTERLSFKIPIISQLNGNRFGVRISVELTVEDSSGTGTI